MVHRTEHSIEFQVLMLQHRLQNPGKWKILPILCCEAPDAGDEEVKEFISALSQTLEEEKGRYLIVAGVDLSHMGKRFGQDVSITDDFLRWVEEEDRKMLSFILNGDTEGFINSILRENNKRNVCGVPALYTLLSLIQPGSSKLLAYQQAREEQTQSVVSFAGAAFYP
jgi:AmmeMemoRadiSam system protein B